MGFEELIRDTIAKQGAGSDRATREQVYGSARAAMERMIARDVHRDDARAAEQRNRLEEAIRRIEGEHSSAPAAAPYPASPFSSSSEPIPSPSVAPSTAPVEPPQAVVPPAAPPQVTMPPRVAPPPAAQTRRERQRVDRVLNEADERQKRPRRKSRPFATLLLWTIVLCGLGAAIWWSVTFGPRYLEDSLGAVANPPRVSQGDDFDPEADDGWIGVFEASRNAATVDAGANGVARLEGADENAFVRLERRVGGEQASIRLAVPPGVMQTIRGRSATFELVARSDAVDQPFALTCDFGDAGACGRKRFAAKPQRQSFLFDATLGSDGSGAGAIVIDPDLAGSEGMRSLDVYSLRVRIE